VSAEALPIRDVLKIEHPRGDLATRAEAGEVRLRLRYGTAGRPEHGYEIERRDLGVTVVAMASTVADGVDAPSVVVIAMMT
jgi:hypothetical protein